MSKLLCGFDTETTGVDTDTARIVTANITIRGGDLDEEVFDWLIDPGVEIPAGAAAVHGVTTDVARTSGADPVEALDDIASILAASYIEGATIVIYNAGYDLRLLENELRRNGLPTLEERVGEPIIRVMDPLVIDRDVDRFRKGRRTLTTVCAVYGVDVSENAHEADADVRMTLDLAEAMLDTFRFPDTDVELYQYQRDAHYRWAENFGAYLRRTGKRDDVGREWF